ncbi:MAG: hypothetical protein KDC00_02925 [Flavobacteriales bacterium]|nr:hypothetical protein [Flavobacteriales bacterium]
MLKFKGIAIVVVLLAFLIISIREQVKDSRPILGRAFGSADHVELRLLNYGQGLFAMPN